eukprot:364870-Chlamydomonas_euryale.AAC.13
MASRTSDIFPHLPAPAHGATTRLCVAPTSPPTASRTSDTFPHLPAPAHGATTRPCAAPTSTPTASRPPTPAHTCPHLPTGPRHAHAWRRRPPRPPADLQRLPTPAHNRPQGHDAPVRGADFSPDGQSVVTGADDATVTQWAVNNGHVMLTLKAAQSAVTSVRFSPSGKMLATASWVSVGKCGACGGEQGMGKRECVMTSQLYSQRYSIVLACVARACRASRRHVA